MSKVILISTPIILLLGYFVFGSIDEDADDYSDLEFKKHEPVPDLENSKFLILDAQAKINSANTFTDLLGYDPDSSSKEESIFHPDHEYSMTYWETVIADNAEALSLIEQALQRPKFYHEYEFTYEDECPHIDSIAVVRLILIRAIYHYESGNWPKCLKDLKLIQNCSKQIYNFGDTFVDVLIGQAIDQIYLSAVYYIIRSETLSLEKREDIEKILDIDYTPAHVAITKSLKAEFLVVANSFDRIRGYMDDSYMGGNSLPVSGFHFHKNRTLNMHAKHMRLLIEASKLAPYEGKQHLAKYLPKQEGPEMVEVYLTPNGTGKALNFVLALPVIGEQAARLYSLPAMRDLLLLKFAINRYKKEHGELPDSLLDLDPYLSKPLYDPFAKVPKTPYRYSKKEKRIWSIGFDFDDQNGEGGDYLLNHSSSKEDIVVNL